MPFPSGSPYDTTPYQSIITFYQGAQRLTSTNAGDVTMKTAKTRAHTQARASGLKAETRQWTHRDKNHARRDYRDEKRNLVKVVIRRS